MSARRDLVPPDQSQRALITTKLDSNLLVEAAAGTGKTTSMIERMVRLLAEGKCEVQTLAAVTFTRKAAAEIRARFQRGLEIAVQESSGQEKKRLAEALDQQERCFVGTIHSFAARLLRERPVEARVDLEFSELDEDEDARLLKQAWSDHVAELIALDDDVVEELEETFIRLTADSRARHLLTELQELGLHVADLFPAFGSIAGHADVKHWPAEPVDCPPLEDVQHHLQDYREHLEALIPTLGDPGNDKLIPKVCETHQLLRHANLEDPAQCSEVLELIDSKPKIVQKQWPGGKQQALLESERWATMRDEVAGPWLKQWREHRYEPIMRAVLPARDRYDALREASNALNYQDLLLKAVALLRDFPEVRRYFAGRFTHLLIDEFQDTDPLQAELLFLLAANDPEQTDWRQCVPRPGSLFIVGDPKQSIYRFRRADIAIYRQAKQVIENNDGQVLSLTANFRSGTEIIDFVNTHFDDVFPEHEDNYRPANRRLQKGSPVDASQGDLHGVHCFKIKGGRSNRSTFMEEAAKIATFIRNALDDKRTIAVLGESGETVMRPVEPADFLLLTWDKDGLNDFTDELHAREIPYDITNGQSLNQSTEVDLLNQCLRSITRPDDPLALVALLRGPLFGISDTTLFRYREEVGAFRLSRKVPEIPSPPADWIILQQAHGQLQRYRQWLAKGPTVTAMEAIAEDLGLFARACDSSIAPIQAGALVKTFELLRQAQNQALTTADLVDYLEGLATCAEAHDALSLAYSPSAVRVMNLHQAKGLEAPVVFLCGAVPPKSSYHTPTLHIRRGAQTEGYVSVYGEKRGHAPVPCLAQPVGWEDWLQEETRYLDAEMERLYYVAATRAARMLIISRKSAYPFGVWRFFRKSLEDDSELEVAVEDSGDPSSNAAPPSPPSLTDLQRDCRNAEQRLQQCAQPTYRVAAAKQAGLEGQTKTVFGNSEHGTEWGTVIHLLLEAVMRNPRARLQELAASTLADQDLDAALVPKVIEVVKSVQKSELWQRARASRHRLIEVPFQYVTDNPAESPATTILRGVIDLAFQEGDAWVLVDYKTDEIEAEQLEELVSYYEGQLKQYVEAWRVTTNEPVGEAGFYFTHLKRYVALPGLPDGQAS